MGMVPAVVAVVVDIRIDVYKGSDSDAISIFARQSARCTMHTVMHRH